MSTVTASWYADIEAQGAWLMFSDEPDIYYGFWSSSDVHSVSSAHANRELYEHGAYTPERRGELISTEEFET